MKTEEELNSIVRIMKAIGESNRLALLSKIMDGVQCNCELGGELNLAPNLISHHLSVLRDSGLINLERDQFDARWIYYSINQETLDKFLHNINQLLDPQKIQPRRVSCGPNSFLMQKPG